MRALTLLSLPALLLPALLLTACLPSGNEGGSKADTSALDAPAEVSDAAEPECEMDGHCPRLQVCEAGACVTRYCDPDGSWGDCGQDPRYDMPRGCYLPLGVCAAPECTISQIGRCLVLAGGGAVGEGDDACVMAVCQPEPPP